MTIKGRKILVGISGGIAAYKAPNLIRAIIKEGAEAQAILTRNGEKFVGVAALSTVTGRPVLSDLFSNPYKTLTEHISTADWADALLVAPASANVLAKFASGLADDYLSTVYLSFKKPVLLCPSMNEDMFNHPATRRNLDILKERGHTVVDPASGELACIKSGTGRLPGDAEILFYLRRALTPQDLRGKRIVVTCGATREAVDPVRTLSNRSSGKMGIALAVDAMERGAKVTLISAEVSEPLPGFVPSVAANSAREMEKAVREHFQGSDVLIMAAAVADFTPEKPSGQKIRRNGEGLTLKLRPALDILKSLKSEKGRRKIVGFALNTQDLLNDALRKLKEKRCDLVVANPLSSMGGDLTEFHVIQKGGGEKRFPAMSKPEAARIINDFVAAL